MKNLDKLTEEQINILKNKATEAPFSGSLLYNKQSGQYLCAGCSNPLFESDAKFDSGSGWPSFDQAIMGSVKEIPDNSHGMNRIEVVCASCGGHLGHVFPDGPTQTTGQRYCINSLSLDFDPKNT